MRITKVIVVLVIVAMSISSVTFAEIGDAEIQYFKYFNEAGIEVNSFEDANEITVKTNLLKQNPTLTNATLITQLYRNGEVIGTYADPKAFDTDAKELFVTFGVPTDTQGLSVKSFIWNSFLDMDFLSNSSNFASMNPALSEIKIYGKSLEGFNSQTESYDGIVLPASSGAEPVISYVAEDPATKVIPTYEDGKILLKAISHGGAEKEYTVNYNKADFAITGITLTKTSDETKVYPIEMRSDLLKYPEYNTDAEGNPIPTVFGGNYSTKATKAFTDVYHIYLKIPEEMIGAKIMTTQRSQLGGGVPYKVKFTLNKTATLYFNTMSPCFVEGATKLSEQIGYRESASYSAVASAAFSPDDNCVMRDIWKINCVVPEGVESKTFEFSLSSYSYSGPMLFIKE